jgi:hypothetical protein
VKTRAATLIFGDIEEALTRFDIIRDEHTAGRRNGAASFVIASNVASGPDLQKRIADPSWPKDVVIHWPGTAQTIPAFIPTPWPSIETAFADVSAKASSLSFAKLASDTLSWKLARMYSGGGRRTSAAGEPRLDAAELTELFEQLVVQLHDFPAPPPLYRPQEGKPPLLSTKRIRIIAGFSGAGKTSWVSQAALHTVGECFLFQCH